MKKIKRTISILLFVFITAITNLIIAQDVTTVETTDSHISENLDMEAVASIFGESEDLEDFEKKLNDPDTQISNLDLNEDGEVDYLRVIETSKDETHLVTIQAVIGKDRFQDVATIDVEKDSDGETQIQVVGDVYMYGPNYIIEPVYVHPPVIFVWFWAPYYNPWYSPYYYGYYPPYYRPWRPYPTPRYKTNVNVHVNVNNSYKHTSIRRSSTSVDLQNKSRKNDYGSKNPDKSFANRGQSNSNNPDLNNKKSNDKVEKPDIKADKKSTGKQVQDDWKPESEKAGSAGKVKDNKVSTSTNKQKTKPTKTPSAKPSTKPASKPAAKPSKKPGRR